MTAVGVGPGRDRHAVLLPCPSGATLVGEQVGSTRTAMTAGLDWDCPALVPPLYGSVGPGRDRHVVLLPAVSGAPLAGGVGSIRTAMTAGPGRDCRVALVPLSSGAARRRAMAGITRTVVARRADRPVGSGQ
ncbi:hypothetical protein ACIP8U_14640 [Streptomyces pseudovenezuelae]|uniref:hypothetical protein n=1 Tax=Streptomyces pseudovenezuelae TaxID=67350 RepID=UPI0036EF705E